MTTDEKLCAVLQKSFDAVGKNADDVIIHLAAEIVARDETLAEGGKMSAERIVAQLDEDSRRREVALRAEVDRLNAALQAIADESQRHHEHNPVSGIDRLPKGYTTIMNLACRALKI